MIDLGSKLEAITGLITFVFVSQDHCLSLLNAHILKIVFFIYFV